MMGGANEPYAKDSKKFAAGTQMLKDRQFKKAHAYFSNMLKSYSMSAFLWAGKGRAEKHLGNFSAAIHDLSKSVDLDYRCANAYFDLSEIYLEVGDYNNALANADKCVRVSRNKPEGYRLRGVAQFKLGKNESALSDLKRAIELGDEDAQFLMQHYKLSERGY